MILEIEELMKSYNPIVQEAGNLLFVRDGEGLTEDETVKMVDLIKKFEREVENLNDEIENLGLGM